MPTVDINLWAVLVAAVVNMVIGMFWYSPGTGLGRAWMKEMKIDPAKITEAQKKGMGKNYFIAFVSAIVMAYVLAHFIDFTGAATIGEGMQAGFWSWFGFIANVGTGMVLWEGKSWKLYAITMGYYFVVLLINGAILATWA